MRSMKWLCMAASLALAEAVFAVDPTPRFAAARALAAGAPQVAAPNREGGVSLVTVTAVGAVEVLE